MMTTETKSTERYRPTQNSDELVTLLTSILQQVQKQTELPTPLGQQAQAAAQEYDRLARFLTHELPPQVNVTQRTTR
jgi:hypothetical protein